MPLRARARARRRRSDRERPAARSQRVFCTWRVCVRPVVVAVLLGDVVVVPGLRRPRAAHLRVERPVGDVEALDRVDERALLQRAGREPLARRTSARIASRTCASLTLNGSRLWGRMGAWISS